MVVELLYDTVAPRLGHGNKPRLNIMEQTKSNQDSHPSWILATSVKDQFIVHLNILGKAQTAPTRPDGIQSVLPSFAQYRTDRATAGSQVDAVEAVETKRAFQIARSYEVHLMDFIHGLPGKLRILSALRFITPCAAMGQLMPTQNPVDRTQRWDTVESQRLQLPGNRLGTTEQPLVVQTQTNQLDRFDHLVRNLARIATRTLRTILRPMRALFLLLIPCDPLVDPTWRIPHGTSYCGDLPSSPIALNSSYSVFDWFSFHRWLLLQMPSMVSQNILKTSRSIFLLKL